MTGLQVIFKHVHCIIFGLFTSSCHSGDHCRNLLLWYYSGPAHEGQFFATGLSYKYLSASLVIFMCSCIFFCLFDMHVGFIKSLLWLCLQEKVVPCPTRLCNTSIPENQKTYLVKMGWLLCKTLKFTFFFNNSLVRQNSHPDYFESLDLVLALYSEQFTLPSNLAYKWQGHC